MEEKMIYAHTGFAKSDSEAVDKVNHPPHYQGDIECIDAMKAMAKGCKVDTHQAYCWQNAFKYIWRWPYKNGVEDLKKAQWYLNRLIEELEHDKHQ